MGRRVAFQQPKDSSLSVVSLITREAARSKAGSGGESRANVKIGKGP